ncbi:MAG: cobyrinate a,c-diamide synthase [Gammaproteobacteria bacterium]|nr:cobyrinate a,c-diamide synthase [Gammaproteobacteria bacterium]MBL7000925.1 cobyrinate a,c-diamide synthase [Gammaproteobacteria bacterium]
MSAFYISAAHKSSGKTTLSIGIASAIHQRGRSVQAFKKGPDYIDPIWLTQATRNACYNLDFFTSGKDFILQQYALHSTQKDVVLVEGNMGLFDGLALDGSDSNAAMARLLNLPVILVIDASGTSRGIAPLLNGYQQFDHNIRYAGVILNKVAGSRHQAKLTQVIEAYTDFPILGAVPRNTEIQVTERHLGLIPSNEMGDDAVAVIEQLAVQAREHIDIDRLLAIESSKPALEIPPIVETISFAADQLRIGVAMDEAFGFYYPGDLERFKSLGVEIVPFSCLYDTALPENLDGLFIGGGFPETQVAGLSANQSMLQSIRQAILNHMPAYAECGGMMYLCSNLVQNDHAYPLCDIIPATVKMNKKPQGRGYVILQSSPLHPWLKSTTKTIQAHEFHYSNLHGLPEDVRYAYSIKRGAGIDGLNDGIVMYNLIASYTHLRQTDRCVWVDDFVTFVKTCNRQN